MSNPKFVVGEVVILCSENQPEHNGEYTIEDVEYGNFINVITKKVETGYSYKLQGLIGTKGNVLWVERVLRKKHIPGSMSFEQLMSSLNAPVKESM